MNKILKASAGTGKTYRLSLEYLNAVFQGEDFRNIVVMTFTRKATAEIRERIIEHLKELKKKRVDSELYQELNKLSPLAGEKIIEQVDAIYEEILSGKEKINVFTIDSFVNKIFKRSIAPYLGIKAYELSDTDEESAEKVFKKILEDEAVFAQMENFLAENRSRKIKDYTDLIADIINQRWKFELIDYQSRKAKENTDFISKLDNSLQIIQDIASKKAKEFNSNYFRKDYKRILEKYLALKSEAEKKELIYNNYKQFLSTHFWNGGKLRGKSVEELKFALEEEYALMQEALANEAFNQEIIAYEDEIFRFTKKIFEFYDQIKFKEKTFTYSDISNYTYQYLREEELNLLEGRKTSQYFNDLLGIEIEYLLIDEFQDTSVLQWKLLKPIINNTDHKIIVGDEKQSIYGWRGGEKELFANLENIIAAEVDNLNICYRSDGKILDFVNAFFSDLHPDWEYEAVDVLPARTELGYLKLLVGGKSSLSNFNKDIEKAKSAEEKSRLEYIQNTVVEDLKAEIASQIAEDRGDLANVAVIARKGDDLEEIAEELDKRNIKYIRGSSNSIIEHEAVKPIYNLFKYLYTADYLSLLKFLRSDLLQLNHQSLKYLLKNKVKIEAALDSEKVIEAQAIRELLSLIKKLKKMSYAELVHHLFNEMGLFSIYEDQASALKNIYFFYELLNQFKSLSSLMQYIEEKKESEELQQLGIEAEDAVQLSTIHKAKGLSFESVFYYFSPKLSKGNNYNSIKIYLDFDQNYAEVNDYLLTNTKYNFILESLAYNFIEDEKQKELMEEINNDYVALTRAAKNLFVYVENPRKFRLDEDLFWSGSNYQFYEKALLRAAQSDNLLELIKAKEFGELQSDGRESSESKVDLNDLAKYFKYEVEPEKKEKKSLNYEQHKYRLLGTIVHDYLQYIKYDRKKEHQLAAAIIRDKYLNIVGKKVIDKLINLLQVFTAAKKDLFADKYEVFTEYTIFAGEEMKRIDRLMIDKKAKKIKIIDYKTGDKYQSEQLEAYAELIESKSKTGYDIETEFIDVKIGKDLKVKDL
ncbi:MAG: DNA helicase UvrD [Halanaerobium sp. MSAO_Bac5]|nr:MAG: DNA helicase UvrD [Halanaerobium sp. MSAO_Bac5]